MEEEVEKKKSFLNNKKKIRGKALSAYVIVIIAIFMLFTFGIGYYLGKVLNEPKNESKVNNEVVDKVDNTDTDDKQNNQNENKELGIDFEAVRSDLKTKNQNGRNSYVVKCTDVSNETDGIKTDEEFIKVSPDTIDVVIDKLKTAKSFESISTGYEGCPPHNILYYVGGETYYSEKDLIIDYGSDDTSLLVGYFGESNSFGGVFKFENPEDINNFIENLEK